MCPKFDWICTNYDWIFQIISEELYEVQIMGLCHVFINQISFKWVIYCHCTLFYIRSNRSPRRNVYYELQRNPVLYMHLHFSLTCSFPLPYSCPCSCSWGFCSKSCPNSPNSYLYTSSHLGEWWCSVQSAEYSLQCAVWCIVCST